VNEAQELARRIGKARFVFTLETGETGKAFGSVTAQDIVNRLKNEVGAEIDRHKIVLERPIKDTGEHEVAIKLHHDVTAQLVFQVKSAAEPRLMRRPPPCRKNLIRRNVEFSAEKQNNRNTTRNKGDSIVRMDRREAS